MGESLGSSLRSLDIVDNLYLLRIRVDGSTFCNFPPEILTSGEFEFGLSFDLWLFGVYRSKPCKGAVDCMCPVFSWCK